MSQRPKAQARAPRPVDSRSAQGATRAGVKRSFARLCSLIALAAVAAGSVLRLEIFQRV